MRVKTLENQTEPSADPIEVFENAGDRERRLWSEAGCDYAYFLVRFLQGKRRLEVQPAEIVKTRLYARSDDLEKRALEMVCATDHENKPSQEDERQLRIRDSFLCDFADKKTLGHADLVAQLRLILMRVKERENFDRATFSKVWESPNLFEWVWGR